MADPVFVVLVSGDPEGHDDGFARCAWLRVAELVNQFFRKRNQPGAAVQADAVVRFIHFDCHTQGGGPRVQIYEHDLAKQKGTVHDPAARAVHKNWKTLDAGFQTAHGPLDQQQDPKTFVEWRQIAAAKSAGSPRAISIVNVYHSVRKAPPGSVLELSIFSHAFVEGPVLYSGSFAILGSTRRSPDDSDGRAAVDFQPDMGEDGAANVHALDEFRRAFASTGSFRIWGCNVQDVVETVSPEGQPRRCLIVSTVLQVTHAGFTRQLAQGGAIARLLRDDKRLPPGSTAIALDINGEITEELEAQRDPFVGQGLTKFPRKRLFEIRYVEDHAPNHAYFDFFKGEQDAHGDFAKTITRSLSDIVKFVAAETIPSYLFRAAEALRTVTVVGGAPGTSADLPRGGGSSSSPTGGWTRPSSSASSSESPSSTPLPESWARCNGTTRSWTTRGRR